MNGILFFRTRRLDEISAFYTEKLGMKIWLRQTDCVILSRGNLLLGFCTRKTAQTDGLITFFTETRDTVDISCEILSDFAESKPVWNPRYGIYHFFARDPEGRSIEIQWFADLMNPYLSGSELLAGRRSVRKFTEAEISDETIGCVLESARYAPSAMNSQPAAFTVVRNSEIIRKLSDIRPGAAPINKAPVAIAVSADPAISRRYIQDADIAAYHFLLSAFNYGLGTCWIADMDRPEVKKLLNLPMDHYISTVTPLGRPAEYPAPRPRKTINMKTIS